MRKTTYILTLAVVAAILSACGASSVNNTPKEKLTVSKVYELIEQKDIYFEADRAIAMQGESRNLTYGYYVKISGDTLDVYLPYFGRSYTAPMDHSNLGIKFLSTDYEYNVAQARNKAFSVTIKPNKSDNPNMNGVVLHFNFFEGGMANLNVNVSNRQPINFNGEFRSNKNVSKN